MKTKIPFILALASSLIAVSCKDRPSKEAVENDTETAVTEEPVSGLSFIDSLAAGEPFTLCRQVLTSREGIMAAFPDSCDTYDEETTPVKETFLYPEKDIRPSDIVRRVRIRYNSASVMSRVTHGIQWYERVASSADDSLVTKQDTLAWVALSQPKIPQTLLLEVIPDPGARKAAAEYLSAYRRFEGELADAPELEDAYNAFGKMISECPGAASEEMLDSLGTDFWQWYDKANFVPGIDALIRMKLKDAVEEMDEKHLDRLGKAVLSEKDIDRRAVLALEYAKFDGELGSVLLGEIIEAGIYTRYILEAWISWRAHVQMNHAMSSFSVIPDNYYDKMKARCVNTLLRHYQDTGDWRDLCLIENFIGIPVLQRQGSYFGNESLTILAGLDGQSFIHPRVSGVDYLKDEL